MKEKKMKNTFQEEHRVHSHKDIRLFVDGAFVILRFTGWAECMQGGCIHHTQRGGLQKKKKRQC
jgi:hypothetical protein